jgi:hypothetical protein
MKQLSTTPKHAKTFQSLQSNEEREQLPQSYKESRDYWCASTRDVVRNDSPENTPARIK